MSAAPGLWNEGSRIRTDAGASRRTPVRHVAAELERHEAARPRPAVPPFVDMLALIIGCRMVAMLDDGRLTADDIERLATAGRQAEPHRP